VKKNLEQEITEILLNNGFLIADESLLNENGEPIKIDDYIDFIQTASLLEPVFGILIGNEDFHLVDANVSWLANLKIIIQRKLPNQTIEDLEPSESLLFN
jgi:hypothetical protein